MSQLWISTEGHQPVVAVALHDGHDVRSEVKQLLAISPDERQREEDPFTAVWTDIAETRLVVLRSRFEIDLNRPRHQAIYLQPEDAWGLKVWQSQLPSDLIERSLAEWVHQHFPNSACVLAIEVKKFFMNEWTHQLDLAKLSAVHQALKGSVAGVIEELQYLAKIST